MTGQNVHEARKRAGLSQVEASVRLGCTQAYLSMVERGGRPLTPRFEKKALGVFAFSPTVLALESVPTTQLRSRDFPADLGALGYPGFLYLRFGKKRNPAQLLLEMLNQTDLSVRVTEAMPWLVLTFPEMDWDWLVDNAKLENRQNRLGFVVMVADRVLHKKSQKGSHPSPWKKVGSVLERSRLVMEDTLCHDSVTQAERHWLRMNRPPEADHWNLLTDMKADDLTYAS
jgi:transcriptional regulator with XRE-family HTH domain